MALICCFLSDCQIFMFKRAFLLLKFLPLCGFLFDDHCHIGKSRLYKKMLSIFLKLKMNKCVSMALFINISFHFREKGVLKKWYFLI